MFYTILNYVLSVVGIVFFVVLIMNVIKYFVFRNDKKRIGSIKRWLFWSLWMLVVVFVGFYILKVLSDLGYFGVYYGESGLAPWCSESQKESGMCPYVLK